MDKAALKALQDMQSKKDMWMTRAIILSMVLNHLGYRTANIMNGSYGVLRNVIVKKAEDIIHDCQMEPLNGQS